MHKKLTEERKRAVLLDVQEAVRFSELAKNQTLEAIARRNGIAKRTVQKIASSKGIKLPKRHATLLGMKGMKVLGVWI